MAKPSLQSTAVAPTTPGFKMPAVFSGPPNPVQARAFAPYITFAHPKRKDEWNKLTAKFGNVEEGDMYFIHKDRLIKLDTAKLGLIAATQYWASKSASGVVQAISFQERGEPFKEHIEAAVLLYLDDGIVPCNVQLRTTKCPMGKALADALAEAATPAWGEKSPAHKETLVLNQPMLRFYGECSLGDQRPGKTSGMPYKPSQCVVKPTSLPEFRLIKQLQEDFESAGPISQLMEMVATRYQSQLKELESKLIK